MVPGLIKEIHYRIQRDNIDRAYYLQKQTPQGNWVDVSVSFSYNDALQEIPNNLFYFHQGVEL